MPRLNWRRLGVNRRDRMMPRRNWRWLSVKRRKGELSRMVPRRNWRRLGSVGSVSLRHELYAC
jgi:hypothetical protein